MEFKDSKTYQNLMKAFAGESQARNKYSYYASKAKKEGYEKIAEIFEETANNEKEHAKLWFKEMHGGAVPSTLENLLDAAAGEREEWTSMYKEMAETAKEEGYDRLAFLFDGVAKIEKVHEERYLSLAKLVKEGTMFENEEVVIWKCRNCGHLHIAKKAPLKCPVCDHPQGYFELVK